MAFQQFTGIVLKFNHSLVLRHCNDYQKCNQLAVRATDCS